MDLDLNIDSLDLTSDEVVLENVDGKTLSILILIVGSTNTEGHMHQRSA